MYKDYKKNVLAMESKSASNIDETVKHNREVSMENMTSSRIVSSNSINLDVQSPNKSQPINDQNVQSPNKSQPINDQNVQSPNKSQPITDESDEMDSSKDGESKTPPKDLMISYSHADKDLMVKLRESLEKNGITIWVDVVGLTAGVDFLSKIGQAIIDAKLFISMVSTSSVKSKYCQDEVALAYIYDKPIFPVALMSKKEILALMDSGMRLQLSDSRFSWTDFMDPERFESDFQQLLLKLKSELAIQKVANAYAEKGVKTGSVLKRQKTKYLLTQQSLPGQNEEDLVSQNPHNYWQEHYKDQSMVSWDKFLGDFHSSFSEHLRFYKEEEWEWLGNNLKREMEVEEDGMLNMNNFIEFCTLEGELHPLWQRTEDYMREMFAMKEVFSMDSTVRVDAIENLGTFGSSEVQEALRDLLFNHDANVRAVAAVSLAKSGSGDNSTVKQLMKCLNDKDRLVREAGCLALGHLRAKQAVPKLLHIWRNEVISHVREAAFAALDQIGGEEVEKAMHVTKVLATEIRLMTEEA